MVQKSQDAGRPERKMVETDRGRSDQAVLTQRLLSGPSIDPLYALALATLRSGSGAAPALSRSAVSSRL